MSNKWRTINSLVHKNSTSTVDEGKERLNPSREKNEGKHRRRKVDEKSCVTFLLCDSGWYVPKPDVQNKWKDNSHTHTQTHIRTYRYFQHAHFIPIVGVGKRGEY